MYIFQKDVFTQMDLDHDDEKVRYLPWLKVRRISAYSSISAPGSTRTSSRTSNKSTHASALTPVPTQSEPSADIDSRSTLVSTSNSMPVTNVALVKQPNSQQFLPAASNTYGFLAPNGCYPSHSVYAGVIGTSSDKLSVPVSQVPLLAPDASRTIPIGLPPLSTVFDGLQQPSASCVPYVHLPTQTQPGLSNPYGEIVYTHSQVTAAAAQSFAGFPASAPSLATNIYAGNEQTAALPSTSGGKVHRNSDANGLLPSDFLRDSHSSNHLSNAYHASGGLTKDSIVDQDMEDFFRTVLEECETRPTTHSESQPFFDEEMDPFLAMDQLT
ncbi:unnamed protein product [Toxocara canis]|uniref:TORC_N domain-containing protein n=1 Tax=Toxocara canis TaxID=6265 RepID=A0A183TWV8_TOXCA|nr:unnamed protein product [Toxocara canis]